MKLHLEPPRVVAADITYSQVGLRNSGPKLASRMDMTRDRVQPYLSSSLSMLVLWQAQTLQEATFFFQLSRALDGYSGSMMEYQNVV